MIHDHNIRKRGFYLGRLQPLHPVRVLSRPHEDVRPHIEDEGVPVVHGRPRDVGQLPQDRLTLSLHESVGRSLIGHCHAD